MVFAVLGWLFLAILSATVVGLALTVRSLWHRLQAFEHRLAERPVPRQLPRSEESPLAGVRVALDVRQDHPNPVFANLLREALVREDAILEGEPDVALTGEIVGNGYADVYFRADLTAKAGGETLFTIADKPPHGDRPANLALEVVQRLKTEWAKRERRTALRELER